MEADQYIANILLSKASVEFVEQACLEDKVEVERSSREHYQKIRKRAYFCRVPRKAKALAAMVVAG